jgi:chromosome segregation ATPase
MPNAPVLTNDPAFLQDQVLRLSAELARAQGRVATEDMEEAPAEWLASSSELPPLLRSYDARIAELERGEASQRDRATAAERELRSLEQSSDRMRVELQNALEAAVRNEALAARSLPGKGGGEALAAELQERLDVLYQENEILVDQQRETGEELERLREEKLAQARDHMSMVKQIAALRDELADGEARSRKAAESRDRARDELQKCAAELITAQENTQSAMSIAERHASERDAALASVSEHRSMLEALNGRAASDREALQADLAVARASERDVRERTALLESTLQQTSEREQALVDRLSAELQDKAAGAEALSALEARCNEAEGRIEALTAELGASQKALMDAGVEHQHLVSKLQTVEGALARSEERLTNLAGEEKTRREALTHSLRKEALSRGAALEEEVRTLEMTVADLNHQLQRAQRERMSGVRGTTSVSLGLVSAQPAGVVGGGGVSVDGTRAMDELAGRLAEAERERDSIEAQRRQIAMQLRSINDQFVAERTASANRHEQTTRSMRRLEDEVGSLRQERAKMLGTLAELEEQANHLRNELSREKHAYTEELRISAESASSKISSLERSLADARALHEQSSKEVENLLKSQEDLSDRYRSEAKTVAERSETLVQELRAESERLSIRNAELSASLHQSTQANGQLDRSEREKSTQIAMMQKQLTELQSVRAQQSGLLTQLREAEKSWQAERRILTRQMRAEQAVSGSNAAMPTGGRSAKAAAAAEVEEALAKARLSVTAA